MKKKLLFVNYGKDLSDKTAWSGTTYSVYKELEKYYIIIPYTIKGLVVWGGKCFSKIASLVTHKLYLYDHSVFLAKYAARQIKKKIYQCNCDCIFVIGGMLAAYLDVDRPIVVLGDAVFSSMVDYYWFNISSKSMQEGNIIQQNLFNNANRVILTSKWAIDAAVNNYVVKTDQVKLIHFGPNIDVKSLKKQKKHNGINLLFVGVDWERKGGAIAVECVEILNKIDNKNEYFLNVVGCIPENGMISNYVKFWGFLNNNKRKDVEILNEIRSISDLFILPTKAECSAIVFCEAAAFSLPVVTFDTGGNKDYIVEDYNGVCLPITSTANDFANTIHGIVQNKEKFKTMKKNAYTYYVNELNWDVFGNKIRKYIDDLL